ncbi:MAG: ferritin-like domain-containing protein [Chitinophagales bacterium]|nr:ferritin-like domain-containing protein [Chitinophagales bacterium]
MTNKLDNRFQEKKLNETKSKHSRRSFLQRSALAGAGLGLSSLTGLSAFARSFKSSGITQGDVDILSFLAAAELIETDLWEQYCELAAGNKPYGDALSTIEDEMVIYICDVTDNERSHAKFINSFLEANGFAPVNLDPFRTLPSSTAKGAKNKGRLTNLLKTSVDTSFYLRYRDTGNPDFGDTYPQFVDIKNVPLIPVDDRNYSDKEIQLIANSAAFHFCYIEQGGTSLYPSFIPKATDLDVLRILTGIGPGEAYHFAAFHQSLEGLPEISGHGLVFPDVEENNIGAHHIPHPCKFIDTSLRNASVVRPTLTVNAGAVATVTSLTNTGLFKGQSQEFFSAAMELAVAADAAMRTL